MDKYKIIHKIAAGGMAEVFLARSAAAMGLGKFVAIKKILPDFSESSDFINMFKAEAKVAMQMQHRNLISIYDFGTDADQCFLVMELVQGLNLAQILNSLQKRQIQIPMTMTLYMMAEAAAGLHYAHDITIHRDISPANLMISYSGEVKVIDFGIAKIKNYGEQTQAGIIKGKINYMSPEQIAGQKLDFRSDIFSLGLVLYEILAGRRVFQSLSGFESITQLRDQKILSLKELQPHLSCELIACVEKAMQDNPQERFSSMDDFSRELRKILNKNYPEFTATELSEFIKKEFFQQYQTQHDQLMEFEMHSTDSLKLYDDTLVTQAPLISNPPLKSFENKFQFKVRKKFRIQIGDKL